MPEPINLLESPIDVVVNRVAADVTKAWAKVLSENQPPTDEVEQGFLALAYGYLTERYRAVYKMERIRHMERVQADYKPPPTFVSSDLVADSVVIAVILVLAMGAIVLAPILMRALVEGVIALFGLISSLHNLVFLLLLIGLMRILFLLLDRYTEKVEYAIEGNGRIPWEASWDESTPRIESERTQIVAMMKLPSGSVPSSSLMADEDLAEANDHPVPLQPGITEYVLSTGAVRLDDLGNDFLQAKRKHEIVFWISFATFILVLLASVADALVFKQGIRAVGGLGAIATLIGTFSYKTLQMSRLSRIALTLFNSYVIELQQRMEELRQVEDLHQARRLRAAAWTNFRTGLNKLYALESRSRKKSL